MVPGVADGEGPVVGEDLEEAAGDGQIGWRRSSISLVATRPMEVRPSCHRRRPIHNHVDLPKGNTRRGEVRRR